MKIGLLVEGEGEYHGFPNLLSRLSSPHTIFRQPWHYSKLQPQSTPAQIAYAASKRFPILLHKGVTLIVIVIDKENRSECTGKLVEAIEKEARGYLSGLTDSAEVKVVLKVTKLENWLVADPQALQDLPGFFEKEKVERIEKQVAGRADSIDALALLKACSRKRAYNKVEGAIKICEKLDPERARKNSRSFCKLLKTLGCAEPTAGPARGRARRR